MKFVRHYQRYAFLATKALPQRITTLDTAVAELEERIALLIKVRAEAG